MACGLLCLASAAGAETVSYTFGSAGYPRTGNFTIEGFDTSLGTLTQAVIDTSGSATFTLQSSSGFAPTVQYNLQSSQGIYQASGTATYGGHGLSGSGTVSYTNPGNNDFTYRVTLTGSGQRSFTTMGQLAQFLNTDISAYFPTDAPSGTLRSGNTFLAYTVVSATAQASGTVTYTYTPLRGAVPEPAGWAMMIGGLGIVGGTLRRRRAGVLPA